MLMTERQSARMSKIKNGGLDQYGNGPFEQQQFGTAVVEGVNDTWTDGLDDMKPLPGTSVCDC